MLNMNKKSLFTYKSYKLSWEIFKKYLINLSQLYKIRLGKSNEVTWYNTVCKYVYNKTNTH